MISKFRFTFSIILILLILLVKNVEFDNYFMDKKIEYLNIYNIYFVYIVSKND